MREPETLTIVVDQTVYEITIRPTGDHFTDSLLSLLIDYRHRRCNRSMDNKWDEFDNKVCKALLYASRYPYSRV